jgi:hypothetical protein
MKTPRSVFLELVRRVAVLDKRAGVLPGRLVLSLPVEDRKILQGLTAKDTMDRQGA